MLKISLRLWIGATILSAAVLGCSDPGGSTTKPKSQSAKGGDEEPVAKVDPERGRAVYLGTCVTCHGQHGQGMPNQGVSLRDSKFIVEHNDEQLFEYLKVGRAANAPDSKTGILMPARGGNQAIDDNQLRDVVAFLRLLQQEEAQ
jgi:mono/diheme cytochrome c family protein